MRKLLEVATGLASTLLVCAVPLGAAPAFIQGTDTTGSGSSAQLSYTSVVTAHSLLVECVAWFTTGRTVSSVTSSPTNTWNSTTDINNSGNVRIQCQYAMNAASGSTTVTVNFNASTSWALAIHEYSGVATSSALDKQNGATGNSSSPSSGSVTTTSNGELIFGWTSNGTTVSTYTAGSGFTQRQSDTATYSSEDQVQATAGAISATWGQGGTTVQWAAKILALCPTGGCVGGAAKPHQLPNLGVGASSQEGAAGAPSSRREGGML